MDEQQTRRAAPGEWYAVVAGGVSLAVPAGARARVAGLWELAEAGAGFDALLDALLVDGLAANPSFVLVEHGERTRALVRGAASVELRTASEEVVVTAEDGSVWAERSVDGVVGGRVVLSGTGDAAVPAVGELLRVSVLEFGEAASAESEGAADAGVVVAEDAEEPQPAEESEVADEEVVAVEALLVEEPETVPAEEPEPVEEPAPAVPEEAAPEPVTAEAEPVQEESAPEPTPPPPPYGVFTPSPAPEAPSAPSFGAPAPVPAYGGPPVPPPYSPALPTDDDAEDTIIGASPIAFERPPSSMAEQAPPLLAKPVAQLVLSTGEVVGVDRAILIGRAPEARRFASDDKPALIVVPSPHQEISSTHLEIRPGAGVDHGMAVVTDLGSTNGTVLVQPGLPPEELQAGVAVALIPGAILDLGDGVTVQVTNA
ncbi:MAG: FHA domain-containing protein [Nocardioides sp.]|uniref:FHA domain-containing protein n=1 Tax=Nocardioides sp. TaxID=35761 RepID=UPI003F109AFE